MTILKQAHERNMLWLGQRDTCLACRNCFIRIGTQGETIMHCRQISAACMAHGMYCVDARTADDKCGPAATLFQPKE